MTRQEIEQHLYSTVRIVFTPDTDFQHSMVGVIYEIARSKITFLPLEAEKDYQIIIKIKNIKSIKKPEL